MRRCIAVGILTVMTAMNPVFSVQVAAQGLAGIETGIQGSMETDAGEAVNTEQEFNRQPDEATATGQTPAAETNKLTGAEQESGGSTSGAERETGGSTSGEERETGSSASGTGQDLGCSTADIGQENADMPEGEAGTGERNTEPWMDTQVTAEPDTEAAESYMLTDTNGDAEIAVLLKDGGTFPSGISFRVLCIADIIGETEEKGARCLELEEELLSAWGDALPAEAVKNVRTFLPYYLLFTDEQGKETELPGEAEIRLTIHGETEPREECFHIAWQGKNDAFQEITEKKIVWDADSCSLTFIYETQNTGWFSLLQTNIKEADAKEVNGSSTEKAGTEMTVQEETDGAAETEHGKETEPGQETESGGETEPGHETETGEMTDIGLERLTGIQPLALAAALAPGGSPVTASGSGFRLMSTSELDGACRTACWYSGISSFVPFSAAGSAVKTMSGSLNGGAYIFYPVNDTAAGKFGGIYQKVLFQKGVWYDLKMTVTAYTNKTWAGTAGTEVTSYPPIGFSQNKIAWWLKPTMGEYILRMEYFRHGDAQQKPVALNSRFQWWEIDNSQRFGIRVENGSIAKKFYQSAGSAVYYKSQMAKADKNTYLFVTASDDMQANDPRGNVGFVLQNCSRYYVAVGYRDHIEESSDYRVSRTTIEKWNTSLKNGKSDEVTLGILVQTGLDVPNPPDPSYPKKYVSNDGVSWGQTNTLPDTAAEYYYKIEQYIPWQTPTNYYEHMVLEDVLPAGADYVGPVTVTCIESGQDASGSFRCVQKNNTVSITPVNLKNESLYGRTYAFVFKVRMNPGKIQPVQTQNTAAYTVVNSAALAYKHSGQTAVSMTSNEVTTQAAAQRHAFPAPVKGLDRSERVQEKELSAATEIIVFSIYQTVPHNENAWLPVQIVLTDMLEPCLEYISAEVFCKGTGGYVPASQWKAETSGQSVVISGDFKTNPPAPDNQTLRFDITCRLKEGYDLDAYRQIDGNRRWYVIPNKACLKVVWAHGSPQSEEKETNTVNVKLLAGAAEAQLFLTKEIDTADIVWAHGNPAFTFCISGEDVLGKRHTWYRTVEFTPQSTQRAHEGAMLTEQKADGTLAPAEQAENRDSVPAARTSASVSLTVPAGWYTVSEEKTMRYRLQNIHSIANGIISGETAVFDVSGGQTGSAVFYNQKTTDEGGSHSAFVKNEIKK